MAIVPRAFRETHKELYFKIASGTYDARHPSGVDGVSLVGLVMMFHPACFGEPNYPSLADPTSPMTDPLCQRFGEARELNFVGQSLRGQRENRIWC